MAGGNTPNAQEGFWVLSFAERPMPPLNREAIDFRAASELFQQIDPQFAVSWNKSGEAKKVQMRRRTRQQLIDELFQHLLQPESRAERYAGIPHHCMLEYEDYDQKVCGCWLRTYPRGDRLVAIATDLTCRLSYGASITSAIELVAREICERFRIRPQDLAMIEHYNWRGTENAPALGKNAEHFDFVDLRWCGRKRGFAGPQWLRLSKSQVEDLIGTPLSDWYTEAVTLL